MITMIKTLLNKFATIYYIPSIIRWILFSQRKRLFSIIVNPFNFVAVKSALIFIK